MCVGTSHVQQSAPRDCAKLTTQLVAIACQPVVALSPCCRSSRKYSWHFCIFCIQHSPICTLLLQGDAIAGLAAIASANKTRLPEAPLQDSMAARTEQKGLLAMMHHARMRKRLLIMLAVSAAASQVSSHSHSHPDNNHVECDHLCCWWLSHLPDPGMHKQLRLKVYLMVPYGLSIGISALAAGAATAWAVDTLS